MTTRQLFIIDPRVSDYETLISSLPEGSQWVLLDGARDGVLQIREILANHRGLDAIQIVSHGGPGALYLGSSVLNSDNLRSYTDALSAIGSSLTETGDLLLYGCNVGQGDIGQAFIAQLAQATGADVAASDDLTGNARLGGDWVLEQASGNVEASAMASINFAGVLEAPILDTSRVVTLGSVLEGAINPAGIQVGALVVGGSITDPDTPGAAIEAIAITALNTSFGTWQYSLEGGASWLTIEANQINSTTNELALLLGPNDKIRLLPFGDLNGTVNDAITFRAWDQSTGVAGQYSIITATGGGTAFSSDSGTAGITVTPVNDAPTFSSQTGMVGTDVGSSSRDFGNAVLVQPDGKIVVAGDSYNGVYYDFGVVRYNPDGSLDTTFNGTGKVVTDFGPRTDDHGYSAILQADGKIVIGGYSNTGGLYGTTKFAVVRYNTDGSLDTTLGGTGRLNTDIGSGQCLSVQPDGRIVVAGVKQGYQSGDFAVIRYNADGGLTGR
jgi:uncharacterized delta-60 repeat protein